MLLLFLLTAVLLCALLTIWWWQRERLTHRLSTVEVITVAEFPSYHLGNRRPLYIYLPPHYHHSQQTYKSLYINDGQDMAALKLHHTLAVLIARQQIEPLVVIAIPTTDERLQEYGTAIAANAQGLGNKAAQYGCFVTEEVMPFMQQNYRVRECAAETAVLGASLGGFVRRLTWPGTTQIVLAWLACSLALFGGGRRQMRRP
ncbi:MAG: hypothetical protein HC804_07290 [Anaerolineae bacterium]|nr:hypothetical protein [Anaerolineae bacterium]